MVMYLHESQGTFYFYADGKCFENGDKYEASVHYLIESKEVVHMFNLIGKMTAERFKFIFDKFREKGLKYITANCPTGWMPEGFKPCPPPFDLHFMEL